MITSLPTPPEVIAARAKGVKVDYSFFADAIDDLACLREAIARHIATLGMPGRTPPSLDRAVLDAMAGTPIDRIVFFGDSYDPVRDGLILRGSGTVEGVGRVTDPGYDMMAGRRHLGWSPRPSSYHEGDYAYAFSQPPLGINAGYAEVEAMFRGLNPLILPPGERHLIRDWRGYDLTRLSDYFNAGAEYWGTFLFTLLSQPSGRLAVVSASASD